MSHDKIWNRAVGFGASTIAGDIALSNSLTFHGLIMNGGLLNAVESSSNDRIDSAVAGYRWLDLNSAANAIEAVREKFGQGSLGDEAIDALEVEADETYNASIPDDATVYSAFLEELEQYPAAFAGS